MGDGRPEELLAQVRQLHQAFLDGVEWYVDSFLDGAIRIEEIEAMVAEANRRWPDVEVS